MEDDSAIELRPQNSTAIRKPQQRKQLRRNVSRAKAACGPYVNNTVYSLLSSCDFKTGSHRHGETETIRMEL
jgi:hypothetical protein